MEDTLSELQAERAASVARLAALLTAAAAKKREGEITIAALRLDFDQKHAASIIAQKALEDARLKNLGHGRELEDIERERSFLLRTAPAAISECEHRLAAIDSETRRDHNSTIGATKSALVLRSDSRSRAFRREVILAAYRRLESMKFESIPLEVLAEEIEKIKKSVLAVEIVIDTVRTESRSFVTRKPIIYDRYGDRNIKKHVEIADESW